MKAIRLFPFTIIIIIAGWSVLLTSCSDHHGKATFDYLSSLHAALNDANESLKQHPLPIPPSPPTFTRQTPPKQRMDESKQYNAKVGQYWNILIESSEQGQKIVLDAENRLSSINADEVDAEAIAQTKLFEQELGDSVQMHVELESFAKMKLTDIQQNRQNSPIGPAMEGLLAEFATANPVIGLETFAREEGKNVEQKTAAQQREQLETANLQKAMATFKADKAKTVTKRNDLMLTLAGKYSHFQWTSIWTNAPASPKD